MDVFNHSFWNYNEVIIGRVKQDGNGRKYGNDA